MKPSYLTGADNPSVRALAHAEGIGLLITPDTKQYAARLPDYPLWAADNACFNHPEDFNTDTYLAWLATFSAQDRARCLFAPAPDVVGDPVRTFQRSAPVLPMIRALGYPAAFVAQDGVERLVTPWDSFDVLFIGGSTDWKLSRGARSMCAQAIAQGKRVHMGRVNSLARLLIAKSFGCDSVDGTFLAFGPSTNLARLRGWLTELRARSAQQELEAV